MSEDKPIVTETDVGLTLYTKLAYVVVIIIIIIILYYYMRDKSPDVPDDKPVNDFDINKEVELLKDIQNKLLTTTV